VNNLSIIHTFTVSILLLKTSIPLLFHLSKAIIVMEPLSYEQQLRLREIIYGLENAELVCISGPLEDLVQFAQLRIMAGLPPASEKTTRLRQVDLKGIIVLN
jgi:hypothetical protein